MKLMAPFGGKHIFLLFADSSSTADVPRLSGPSLLGFNISTCSGFSKVCNSPKVFISPLVPVFAAPFPCPSFILRLSYELRAVM